MNKKILLALFVMLCVSLAAAFAQSQGAAPADSQTVEQTSGTASSGLKYVAAALAVGIACIGGGSAVGKIGAAAMGAMSENAELSGKALPFVGLAEGICLWGFLVALFIILM
ncbi:MAG: ATP synthase subunit C [Treponema sp.]|nr:ATPase [Treponema sp.]MCR5623373.1 ATP synthase subunit C [Treponema sp.]